MKPENVYVFTTPDVPGYKFVAARGENLIYDVEFPHNVDSINEAVRKAVQHAKKIAAHEGFNCIVNLNPEPIFHSSGTSNFLHCVINLNFTIGTLYL